jgi:hypothetical protein
MPITEAALRNSQRRFTESLGLPKEFARGFLCTPKSRKALFLEN